MGVIFDDDTSAPAGVHAQAALAAFRNYFAAFMRGSLAELLQHIALPCFMLRGEELMELHSDAQVDGFRRGLRARMAALGITGGGLEGAKLLEAGPSHALIQFSNTRTADDGSVLGIVTNLAHLRFDAGAWRVWMITSLTSSPESDEPAYVSERT